MSGGVESKARRRFMLSEGSTRRGFAPRRVGMPSERDGFMLSTLTEKEHEAMKRRIYGLLAVMCLILAATPAVRAADIVSFAVTDGNIQFDKSTGTVPAGDRFRT